MLSVAAEDVVIGGDSVAEISVDIVLGAVVLDFEYIDMDLSRAVEFSLTLESSEDIVSVAIARKQESFPLLFDEKHQRGEVGSRDFPAPPQFFGQRDS